MTTIEKDPMPHVNNALYSSDLLMSLFEVLMDKAGNTSTNTTVMNLISIAYDMHSSANKELQLATGEQK